MKRTRETMEEGRTRRSFSIPFPSRSSVLIAPMALARGAPRRLGFGRSLDDLLIRSLALSLLCIGAVPGERRLVPRVAAAGAAGIVPAQMLEGRREIPIAMSLQVDHVFDALAGVAEYEHSRARWAALLAALGIAGETVSPRGGADREIEPIAEPDAKRLEGAAIVVAAPLVVLVAVRSVVAR